MDMKKQLSFVSQYVSKPKAVGAVLPSSKYLACKMVESIDFDNAECIVEYGCGTGVFTDKILQMRKTTTILMLFENNETFFQALTERYKGMPNIHIVNDSAEHVGKYLVKHNLEHADYIVSGLPFTSLPREVSVNILKESRLHLKPTGSFITFQYTLFKKDFIQQFFDDVEVVREIRNVPPAYVLRCH